MKTIIYRVLTRTYPLLAIALIFGLLSGCEKNDRRIGEMELKGALGVRTATPKAAYVLSGTTNEQLNNFRLSNTQNLQTQNPNVPQNRDNPYQSLGASSARPATSFPSGYYGLVSVVAVDDATDLRTTNSPGTLNFNYYIPDYNSGITGVATSQFGIVDQGISPESHIAILPDRSSIIVSSPNTGVLTQFFISPDNGNITGKTNINLGNVKPTRFVATNDFKNNPFIFVATSRGIAVIKFDTATPHGAAGRVFGDILPLTPYGGISYESHPTRYSSPVLDLAISADDEILFASDNQGKIYYKNLEYEKRSIPFGFHEYKGYIAKKLASAPMSILEANSQTIPYDSVGALTPTGFAFINSNDPPFLFAWSQLRNYNPTDIDFHPSGDSVLILTDNYLFTGQLLLDGQFLTSKTVGPEAKEMAIDPGGSYLGIVASNGLSLYPLDEGGVVSAGNIPIPIPGDTVGVALK